jgi:hypothetical protein
MEEESKCTSTRYEMDQVPRIHLLVCSCSESEAEHGELKKKSQ